MHRIIALGSVLGLTLLGLWRLWPAQPRAALPTDCLHPVGIASSSRPFVLCWPSSRIRLAELHDRLGLPRCGTGQELPTAMLVDLRRNPCRPQLRRLPGGWWLPLGLRIDVNQATAEELRTLPRIGPVLARRIVEERQRHGPFSSLAALRRVRGIGPATVQRLRKLVAISSK